MDTGQIFVLVLVLGVAGIFVWAEIKTRRSSARGDGAATEKK